MNSFSAPAVIVGCLPPFKSLFQGRGSFRRHNSPIHNRNLAWGLHDEAIRLGSAEIGASVEAAPKVMTKSTKGKQYVVRGGYDMPRGAIIVRSDYVSLILGAWKKKLT